MVRANNYETMSAFVKVMQKKLWPLFSGHGVQFVSNGSLLLMPVCFDARLP